VSLNDTPLLISLLLLDPGRPFDRQTDHLPHPPGERGTMSKANAIQTA
jgi:hypothetical protein